MDFDMKDFEELKQDINLTRDQLEDLNNLRKNVRELQRIRDEASKDIADIYSHLLDEDSMLFSKLGKIEFSRK